MGEIQYDFERPDPKILPKFINSVGLRLRLTITSDTEFIRDLEEFPGEELAPKMPDRNSFDGK